MGVIIFISVLVILCLVFYIVAEVKQNRERKEKEERFFQEKLIAKKEYLTQLNTHVSKNVSFSNPTPKKKKEESLYHNTIYVAGFDPYESANDTHSQDANHFSGGFGGGSFSGGGAGSSWSDNSSDSSSYDSGSSDSSCSND